MSSGAPVFQRTKYSTSTKQKIKLQCMFQKKKKRLNQACISQTIALKVIKTTSQVLRVRLNIIAIIITIFKVHIYNLLISYNFLTLQLIQEWVSGVITNRSGEVPTQSTITFIWAIAVSIFCIGGMIGGALTGRCAFFL